MATFVLVHGAWHGGWCWALTEAALRQRGHAVHSPTLTGLGERSHLLSGTIDADLHVRDIINVLQWRELREVILVGHSYAGMVITGVAGQTPARIRALVYLDAFVPEVSGTALFATAAPERMEAFQKQIDAGAIGLAPDRAIDTWTDDPQTRAWLERQCTSQPRGTFQSGVTLTGEEATVRNRHYIWASRNKASPFVAEYEKVRQREDWTTDTIPTLHDAMVEAPALLAEKLDAYAAAFDKGPTGGTRS